MSELITGVMVKKLAVRADERGRLTEILRNDDEAFIKFGQVYMTTAYPGVIKGWHYHRLQTDNFAVVKGMIKLVLYDSRESSPTRGMINEFFLGDHSPILVRIPNLVYHGFKCISLKEAIVINCVTEPYNRQDPDEVRVDPYDKAIPYDWALKMK
jgi:dTDP-4-dehydrorhamnose 3,5-epimerase